MGDDHNKTSNIDELAKAIRSEALAEDSKMAKAMSDFGAGIIDEMKSITAKIKSLSKGAEFDPMATQQAAAGASAKGGAEAEPKPAHDRPPMAKADDDTDDDTDEEPMEKGIVNVTEFLDTLKTDVASIAKMAKAAQDENIELKAMVKAQAAQIANLAEIGLASMESNARLHAKLAKGVQSLGDNIQSVSEVPMELGSRLPRQRVLDRHTDGNRPASTGYLGGSQNAEKRLLAKAQQKRIVSDTEIALFQRTGSFVSNDEANQTLRTRIESLNG